MHKLLISLLLLVGFSSLPFALQIEVKDTEGKPLPFCHLRVENQKTSSFFLTEHYLLITQTTKGRYGKIRA